MVHPAVGVAAELAVVGPPRVGGLDDPSHAEAQRLALDARELRASALDVEIVEPVPAQLPADDGVVVAAVEVQGVDVAEQTSGGHGLQGGHEQGDVVAVGGGDGPAEGYAVAL